MENNISLVNEKNLIKKYPLIVFSVFSYVFFLLVLLAIGVTLNTFSISPFVMNWLIAIGSWTPNVAVLLVVWVNRGPSGIKNLFAGWLKWRVHPGWYLFGLMPLFISLALAGGYLFLGGKPVGASTDITATVFFWMLIFNLLQGATGEELGWRGFALPRLQKRYSTLVSAIILGLLIAGWHSILHLFTPSPMPEWQFWLMIVCYSIIVAWGYNRSGASLLIVSLLHFSFNFGPDLVNTKMGLIPAENLYGGFSVIYAFWVLGIIVLEGKKFWQKPAPAVSA
jgi:uncharacterized protein